MKLLRDFFRLRTAGRALLGRRAAASRHWTITVPAPLEQAAPPVALDAYRNRSAARRHEPAALQEPGHRQLVSQR